MIVLQIFAVLGIYGFMWLLGMLIRDYRYNNINRLNKKNKF